MASTTRLFPVHRGAHDAARRDRCQVYGARRPAPQGWSAGSKMPFRITVIFLAGARSAQTTCTLLRKWRCNGWCDRHPPVRQTRQHRRRTARESRFGLENAASPRRPRPANCNCCGQRHPTIANESRRSRLPSTARRLPDRCLVDHASFLN